MRKKQFYSILLIIMMLLQVTPGWSKKGNNIKKGELEVFYVGSAGYVLKTKNKKIMVDAVFDNFVKKFEVPVPSENIRKKIGAAQKPFNSIDLFLISHEHKGHFDYKLFTEALKNNPKATVITNKGTYNVLKKEISSFASFKKRIYFPKIKVGESKTKIFKGIPVRMTKSNHWGGLKLLNFEFKMDGINIVYALESKGFSAKKQVDIQFHSEFKSGLNPKHIILTHQSGNKKIAKLLKQSKKIDNVSFLTVTSDKLNLIKRKNKIIILTK